MSEQNEDWIDNDALHKLVTETLNRIYFETTTIKDLDAEYEKLGTALHAMLTASESALRAELAAMRERNAELVDVLAETCVCHHGLNEHALTDVERIHYGDCMAYHLTAAEIAAARQRATEKT